MLKCLLFKIEHPKKCRPFSDLDHHIGHVFFRELNFSVFLLSALSIQLQGLLITAHKHNLFIIQRELLIKFEAHEDRVSWTQYQNHVTNKGGS